MIKRGQKSQAKKSLWCRMKPEKISWDTFNFHCIVNWRAEKSVNYVLSTWKIAYSIDPNNSKPCWLELIVSIHSLRHSSMPTTVMYNCYNLLMIQINDHQNMYFNFNFITKIFANKRNKKTGPQVTFANLGETSQCDPEIECTVRTHKADLPHCNTLYQWGESTLTDENRIQLQEEKQLLLAWHCEVWMVLRLQTPLAETILMILIDQERKKIPWLQLWDW